MIIITHKLLFVKHLVVVVKGDHSTPVLDAGDASGDILGGRRPRQSKNKQGVERWVLETTTRANSAVRHHVALVVSFVDLPSGRT
jgi:hypothetical protein